MRTNTARPQDNVTPLEVSTAHPATPLPPHQHLRVFSCLHGAAVSRVSLTQSQSGLITESRAWPSNPHLLRTKNSLLSSSLPYLFPLFLHKTHGPRWLPSCNSLPWPPECWTYRCDYNAGQGYLAFFFEMFFSIVSHFTFRYVLHFELNSVK